MRATLISLMMCLLLSFSNAQQGGDFDLSWWSIDAGGYTFATGGQFELGLTIGQHDAHAELYVPGGTFLNGGFWFEPCLTANGDVDRNGCVDDADLLQVLFAFGAEGPNNADQNCDLRVDDADLLIVLFNFGAGC